MKFTTTPVSHVARLAALRSPGQSQLCLLIAPQTDRTVEDLRDEIDADTGESLACVDVTALSAEALIGQLTSVHEPGIVVSGFESWTDEQFIWLDIKRGQLETDHFVILKMNLETASRFLRSAPNIRSYVASNIFFVAPDTSGMSLEEVDRRLDQLRSHFQMSDDELIKGLSDGTKQFEPEFAEWLILLGRTNFVG